MSFRRFTLLRSISIISPMKTSSNYKKGSANPWMIVAIGGLVLFLVAGAAAVWFFLQYKEQKTDVDGKIKVAVAEGKREQMEIDDKNFQEKYKDPRLEFVGPAEYGRVSFMYPRTWSVYVDKDGSDRGDYNAFMHPVSVPPVASKDSRFALRLEIINKDYDTVLKTYEGLLKKGDLTSSTPEFNGNASTRLDGAFSKELRGSAVLMRVRDKTIRFSTDADTFKPDFEAVLNTVKFIQ